MVEVDIKLLGKQYDEIHSDSNYHEKRSSEKKLLELLSVLCPYKSRVIDAGCGFGLPVLKYFSNYNDCIVYGTDISKKSLEIAKSFCPNAIVSCQDTANLNFDNNYFDLAICLNSIMHIPVDKQEQAILNFYNMLVPGGYLYVNFATFDYTGKEEFAGIRPFDNHDLPCFHTTPAKYINIFKKIGFEIVESNNEKMENFEIDSKKEKKYNELFYVLARKPIPEYAIHFKMVSHIKQFKNLEEFFIYEESLLTNSYTSIDWESDLFIALSREYINDRLVQTWSSEKQEYSYYIFTNTIDQAKIFLDFVKNETRLYESIEVAKQHGLTTESTIIKSSKELFNQSTILLERYRNNAQ